MEGKFESDNFEARYSNISVGRDFACSGPAKFIAMEIAGVRQRLLFVPVSISSCTLNYVFHAQIVLSALITKINRQLGNFFIHVFLHTTYVTAIMHNVFEANCIKTFLFCDLDLYLER